MPDPNDAVAELEAQIAEAEASKEKAIASLEGQLEDVAQHTAEQTRQHKGAELARRTWEAAQDRLSRDKSELPDPKDMKTRKTRTGFALLRSNQPANFNNYMSQVVGMIEEYDGDILDLKYSLDRSMHFVALTYNMPAKLFDILPAAIRELKKLHSA